MADIPTPETPSGGRLEACIGFCVVVLATFLGVANVKDDNIVQKMQLKQAEYVDNWSWFQARNIRATVYKSFAEDLSIPWPNETPEIKAMREKKSAAFLTQAQEQEARGEKQKADAIQARKDYDELNAKDDQFDLCSAAVAIGLALMGVTALARRWWLFAVALVPSVFGILMGIAGFLGMDTRSPAINWFVELLS